MIRVLDIDLDFFVHGVEYYCSPGDDRPDGEWNPPWSLDEAMAFLTDRCGLADRKPGFAVEQHDETFARWRTAIERGQLAHPFHVTHVDAHADLGLGDAGYVHLMTDVMHCEPEHRWYPGPTEPSMGNWLAFAVACGWIESLDYIHNDEGGNDLLPYHMENDDPSASSLQLKATTQDELEKTWFGSDHQYRVDRLDPKIPFSMQLWSDFTASAPYDVVCICRSPEFAPAMCDEIFDVICREFIDETAFD